MAAKSESTGGWSGAESSNKLLDEGGLGLLDYPARSANGQAQP